MNKTWGQTFLTHDTPEGSIIKSSGPSGPWELNRTLWEKERCRSFTVQQHTKQNADCSIETFLNVSKKIPTVFFRISDFIQQLDLTNKNKNWEVWHKKAEIWNKSWKEKKVRKAQKKPIWEFFFYTHYPMW